MVVVMMCLALGAALAQPAGTPRGASGGGDTTKGPTQGQIVLPSMNDSLVGYFKLREKLLRDSAALHAYLDSIANTPMAIMQRNLVFSYRDWAASAADIARRDEDIKRSQGWDKVFQNIPRVTLSVPLRSIGQALGLVEDVSPRIKYTVLRTERVTVKVYDISAKLVVVLHDDVQAPGEYRFDWNMCDSTGARVELGNYVAEVIMESKEQRRLLLRKRIEVP